MTEQDVVRHCAERLARFKVPRSVVFLDELPHNATGKIQKHELRARYGTACHVRRRLSGPPGRSGDDAVDLELDDLVVGPAELAQDVVGVLGEVRRPARR